MQYSTVGVMVAMVQHLPGPILWDCIYADRKEAITEESVVPRQVHLMLKTSISKLDMEFKKYKEIEALHQTTWEEARTTKLAFTVSANQQY